MLRRALRLALFRTRAVLLWERVYAALAPLFVVLAVFLGLGLFGVWGAVPGWLHLLGCAAAIGAAVWAIVKAEPLFVMPSRADTQRRLESESALPRGTLADLADMPLTGDRADPLWQAHKRRLARTIKRLRPGRPRALIDSTDPYALRIPAALLLLTGLLIAGPAAKDRIVRAMTPQIGTPTTVTADLWIDPPDYTRQPPTFLLRRAELPGGEQAPIRVPQGSVLHLRSATAEGDRSRARVWIDGPDGREPVSPTGTDAGAFELPLEAPGMVTVKLGGRRASYPIETIPDQPPTVRLLSDPRVEGGTRLVLSLDIDDDYGVESGAVELRLAANLPRPPDAPSPAGPIPAAQIEADALSGPAGTREVILDLTEHPWAGLPVSLKVGISDGAGQSAVTEPRPVVLPERHFYNPLSRAVIEERRNLALAPYSWRRTRQLFEALTVSPDLFAADAQEYILMRTAYHDIDGGRGRNVDDLVETLWPLAIALEDEGLTLARQRLEAAQEALREAIDRGAPQAEIDQLVENLRQAMADYLAALAASEDALAEAGDERETLEGQDLNDLLDEIADLRRQGDSAAARERLAELERMLQNLQISRGGSGSGSGTGQQSGSSGSQQAQGGEGTGEGGDPSALGASGDLIDQQRRLSDETYSARRGENGADNLAARQRALVEAARRLREQSAGDDGNAAGAFDRAAEAMERASRALARGDLGGANAEQEIAIGHLREGAGTLAERALAEENRGKTQGAASDSGSPAGQSADRDPLGRVYQQGNESGIDIPDFSDPERVRELARTLRERLRDPDLPEAERQYYERLLKRF